MKKILLFKKDISIFSKEMSLLFDICFKIIFFEMFIHILFFFIHSRFSDFFPEYSCAFSVSNPPTNYHMFDCFFSTITRNANGGVLYFDASNVHLVVEYCTFDSIISIGSTRQGGAIYCSSTTSGSAFSKICAYNCSCGTTTSSYYGDGQFSYIKTDPNKINKMFQVSISFSASKSNFWRRYGFYLNDGIQEINNLNSSYCSGYTTSSFYCLNPTSLLVTHANVVNSDPYSQYVVYFQSGTLIRKMQISNFVNNTSSSGAVIYGTTSETQIIQCIFTQNKDVLFSGTLNVSQSWIHHEYSLSAGTVVILSSTITTQGPAPTFELQNYASAICITPTPGPTPGPTNPPVGEDISPCMTLPPLPTACNVQSECVSGLMNLNNVIHFLQSILVTFLFE